MRQADSTIRGYLYQFNKSILEILRLSEDDSITLEGTIEDIDILSPTSATTIQCKYHEDKKYQISSVAVPIIEMLCSYCESSYIGKDIKYFLYAYFSENVDSIEMSDFVNFLNSTQDKDILIKYFHRIYSVPDSTILSIANKGKKNASDKEKLATYYKANRVSLSLRVNISDFWACFKYIKAEKFDELKESVIRELGKITDQDTAVAIYYPNAFSYVALLSAKPDVKDRTVVRSDLINFLAQQKTILLNKWTLEATGRKKLLKSKKDILASLFATNPDVRAFVFSDEFLKRNSGTIIPFIREYISKYFKKPKLQKPPVFVFGDNCFDLMQNVIIELYKYQQSVNTGLVGMQFVEDSFIYDKNCPSNYACKIALLSNITANILEQCHVNQLYAVGTIGKALDSNNYFTELLDVPTVNELRYLVGLNKSMEV